MLHWSKHIRLVYIGSLVFGNKSMYMRGNRSPLYIGFEVPVWHPRKLDMYSATSQTAG